MGAAITKKKKKNTRSKNLKKKPNTFRTWEKRFHSVRAVDRRYVTSVEARGKRRQRRCDEGDESEGVEWPGVNSASRQALFDVALILDGHLMEAPQRTQWSVSW